MLGLVGAVQPVRPDLESVGQRLAALPAWSRDSLLAAPRAIAMLYVGDLSLVADALGQAPLNDDDRPVMEFLAPRMTRMNAAGDKDWLTGTALADYTEMLVSRLAGKTEPALPSSEATLQARRAGAALFRYAIAATSGDGARAEALMREVSRMVPEVVASANQELGAGDLADIRHTLSSLRAEQERLRRQLQSMEQRMPPAGGQR